METLVGDVRELHKLMKYQNPKTTKAAMHDLIELKGKNMAVDSWKFIGKKATKLTFLLLLDEIVESDVGGATEKVGYATVAGLPALIANATYYNLTDDETGDINEFRKNPTQENYRNMVLDIICMTDQIAMAYFWKQCAHKAEDDMDNEYVSMNKRNYSMDISNAMISEYLFLSCDLANSIESIVQPKGELLLEPGVSIYIITGSTYNQNEDIYIAATVREYDSQITSLNKDDFKVYINNHKKEIIDFGITLSGEYSLRVKGLNEAGDYILKVIVDYDGKNAADETKFTIPEVPSESEVPPENEITSFIDELVSWYNENKDDLIMLAHDLVREVFNLIDGLIEWWNENKDEIGKAINESVDSMK